MEQQLLDPSNPDVRVEFGMAVSEVAQRAAWRAHAELFGAVDDTLAEAAAHPELFVVAKLVRGDAVDLAVRSAAADLAVRLSISENTVRNYGHCAATLRQRLPELWSWFREGEISTPNAREAAAAVSDLSAEQWPEFARRVVQPARTLAPARFRTFVRALAERLRADSLDERHRAAKDRRGVWSESDRDGMAWLNLFLPSADVGRVMSNLDDIAFSHYTEPDETRTMAQLRADAAVDLLTGAGTSSRVGVTVAVTVPVMTLLGQSTEPAVMEGIGPIDLETARALTAAAPSLTRLLTDPVSGEILTMDSRQYRPPAALRRWLALTQVTCDFPGCGRRAEHCDLDHTVGWAEGGLTTAANLVHRCRKHHRMKHETKWRVTKPPGASVATWISPTGYARHADPPPF
jgi:hypothetical protein